ncbi:MAG: hypothetical protein JXB88_03395 [Spirochaetales bacterium]|nr:hypothetical protein [Spirochaetales bacterium]
MKKKPGIIILFFACALIIGFVASNLLTVYVDINKEIAIAKKAPRAETSATVLEYQNKPCWISGTIKAADPAELLVSRGAEMPCVYFSYTSEYATYDTDSDGDVDKTWHISEKIEKLADIPFTVQDRKFRLIKDNLRVKGGLVETLNRNETLNHTEYRYSEYIIPDGTPLRVLGIPDRETIRPTHEGLVITMNTPDRYIGETATTSVILLVIVCVLFCIAVFFTGLGVWMVRK